MKIPLSALGLLVVASCASAPDRREPVVASGTFSFPETWIDGTSPDEPAFQIHAFTDDVLILRQSVLTNFEAPFLFLIFGEDRALLLDSGAGDVPIRETVDVLLEERGSPPLIVAHSHAHGDHTAGDEELRRRPDTVVVGTRPAEVAAFFGIEDWPNGQAELDLGGRVLDILPIPGHERSSIAIYDRRTGILLTGDTVYPGRLYVIDFPAFRDSIERLVTFAEANPVSWVLGTHIEMTNEPGVDFEFMAPSHPNERRLELTAGHLVELRDALRSMGAVARRDVRDDFVVYPLRPRRRR